MAAIRGPGSGRRVVLAGADLGAQDLAGGTGIGCFHLGLQLQYSPLPAKGVLLADYANLGRSGLSVSRLCLGTMNFGPLTPPAQAHVIMDHAHDLGINFDTANRRRAQAPG